MPTKERHVGNREDELLKSKVEPIKSQNLEHNFRVSSIINALHRTPNFIVL